MEILILQNKILHYRKPIFNRLAQNHDITILHSGKETVTDSDLYNEVICSLFKLGPVNIQLGVLFEVIRGNYDFIISMFDLHWIINYLLIFIFPDEKILLWGHRYSERNNLINKVKDFIIKRSNGVILYGGEDVGQMIKNDIAPSKIFIAPNTLEVKNFSDCSSLAKDSFLFVGRAQKRKRVDLLIQAFSEVETKLPEDTVINIIGSGKENNRLKRLAEKLNVLQKVQFHGKITDDEKLKNFFQTAYAYVSPGPVGLGVLHSFAYGVPVITSKNCNHGPEFHNLINRENALIFESFDELKKMLIAITEDKELASKLGDNAFSYYSTKRTTDQMVSGFLEAIEKN